MSAFLVSLARDIADPDILSTDRLNSQKATQPLFYTRTHLVPRMKRFSLRAGFNSKLFAGLSLPSIAHAQTYTPTACPPSRPSLSGPLQP